MLAVVPLLDGADIPDDTGVDFGLPKISKGRIGFVAGGAFVVGIVTDHVAGLGIGILERVLTVVTSDLRHRFFVAANYRFLLLFLRNFL